nr:RNA-directed DNA polymerase, eukaryota, reverse transcriptase zinc-binding domain protein [Tanacetum cinerariifolium]
YGHVVDAYIPLKRSKAGKRFGFVMFINVFSVERLVNNLCTVWIGHHTLHANITRFQRPPVKENKSASLNGRDLNFNSKTNGSSYVYRNQKDSGGQSYVNVVKRPNQNGSRDIEPPTMVLEDNCILSKDMTMCLLGRVKKFVSLANMKVLFNNEGFTDLKICYMGELWVMMVFGSENSLKLFKENVSIGSWFSQIINASLDFVPKGRIAWIEVEGVPMKLWSENSFKQTDEDDQSDVNSKGGMPNERETRFVDEFDGEDVPETLFEEEQPIQNQSDVKSFGKKDDKSEDTFNIYPLLKKTDKNTIKQESESILNHPLGLLLKKKQCGMENSFGVNKDNTNPKDEVSGSTCSEQFKKPKVSYTGRSMLNLLDDVVKVGRVMGYNMDGCLANMENIIESQGVDEGCNSNVSDYFVMVHGVWRQNGKKVLFIAIYAPQDVKEKSMLWDYLTLEISRWKRGRGRGCSYTWCHKSAMKMSKLDRFLVSDSILNIFPHIYAITLERYLLDHRPILLREHHVDYGSIPFRFFHYWYEVDGFSKFVEDVWNESPNNASNDMVCFMDFKVVEGIIDDGKGNEEIVLKRAEIVKNLHHIDKLYSLEMAQKAKVKWAIEGDENSSFFHDTLSKKRNVLSVRGIMVDGVWIDDPALLKHEFLFHFRRRHGEFPKGCNSNFIALIPKIPDANLVKDFRPISLIGSLYKIIAKVLANRLTDRQILDGPFILDEVIRWCKRKKSQALVFKVDFEKAYDSVRWDFLDDILRNFGFGDKWRKWIQSCLRSSRGSIILNGSPTKEFQFYKGLKQEEAGMFKGIKLDSSTSVSHLFYADDAVFVGQWCDSNINTLVSVLECFNKASGLRINMSKSKLMVINVDNARIKGAALKLGCLSFSTPFSFIGTTVGGSMCRIQTWENVVQRVKNRLSKWKMKMLSISGRLTLLKSVLESMPIFHMSIFKAPLGVLPKLESIRSHFFNGHSLDSNKASWVKWKSVLASKDNGGLGVSSLYALNRALMFKWIWRFHTHDLSLWVKVIKAVYGTDGNMDSLGNFGYKTSWLNIVQEVNSLKMKDIDLYSHMCFNLGNGEKARFWDQRWVEGDVLKIRFLRIYALERSKDITVGLKLNHHSLDFSFRRSPIGGVEEEQFQNLILMMHNVRLLPMEDRWRLDLNGSGDFSVASVRRLIDDVLLPKDTKTRWTRSSLIRFILDLEFLVVLVRLILRWWDLDYEEFDSYEQWATWLANVRIPIKNKMMLEGVFYVMWWFLWSFRNKM